MTKQMVPGWFLASLFAFAQAPQPSTLTAAEIMAKVAANVESATEERTHYIYHQSVRSSLVRGNGKIARREKREYSAIPAPKATEKHLDSFTGEYRSGKQMVAYSEPRFKYKGVDLDGDLITDLTEGLVNDKDTRDGIPHQLFPFSSKDLPKYTFTLESEPQEHGRRMYQIAFEPLNKTNCVHIGGDEDDECGDSADWAGDAWIDAEELQPVRVITHLKWKVPWGIRVFLGTNLRQTGFTINYLRVAPNVWFPSTYGTEFELKVLWGYTRTITLSMENTGFKRAGATSTIEYTPSK